MNVAIIGYGAEGTATCDYYLRRGDAVTVCDTNEALEVPAGATTQLGENYLRDLDRFDVIVRTAGMHPNLILAQNPSVAAKITTHIDEFLRVCPTQNVIGVTGTKGKGTTSSLIYEMLRAAGKSAYIGGNIGIPPLGFLPVIQEESWVVLELSSFQLIDIQHSPHVALCLMVVPEHLNWHADMDEYLTAKSQLFAHQTDNDIAIYFAENDNSLWIANAGQGKKIPYYQTPGALVQDGQFIIDEQTICNTTDLKLLGQHNWQNACAAITAVWQAGIHDVAAMREVLMTFSGLEHRLELVRELHGVTYYDDSFGTTPETAIVAIQAFEQPKVVILGGSDKGAQYDELATAVQAGGVRSVILIGEQAKRINDALEAVGFTGCVAGGSSMEQIVATAQSVAREGDVVLLSTACASFDMFKDYKDRGDQFKQAVRALA